MVRCCIEWQFIFSGSTFTTPTLNSNTTYYVESENGSGCKSTRTSVTVTIDAAPSSPTVIGTSICSGQTAMLTPSAPSGVTFNWYDAASNGNLLFSGSTFTTPTLNSNTTYYVESENGSGCKSTRTSVTVTIDAAPSSPTVIGTSICSGQTAMLTPSAPSGVTFNWYDAASNGNLLFSGSTFTTPTLNSNTTYYVESENGSGCKSTRTSVTVTIDAAPSSPTVSGTSICSGQTAMLTPSAPSGVTFNWYDAASNGNLLFSGSTFTTPTLNSNTTYYVESENGSGCKSTRTSVTVTIDAAPSSPTVIGTSICSGQTAMLTPSAPSGVTFNWYDAASNGNLLFSGSTFTTPTLNSNTTYYVESENGSGCKSTRTSVTVTIDAAPSSPTVSGTSICSGQTAMLTPSAPSGVTFNWYDAASNGNLLFSGSTFTTPTLNSNTTYYVESENGSGCKSTRTSVTVTIDAAPSSPTVIGTSICSGQTAMLTPSAPSGVTFNWYDAASNGNLLFSGSTFTTPTLNSNTTYYVESENGSGCKSTRTSVTVTIDAAPSSPTVIGTSICSGQTAMLTPSAPSGVTFNWYDAASNGNLLFSGSTFTTPTLNSNTTYYVESENGSGCKSTRTSVTVTIDAAPSSPTVIGTSICSGQTAMLTPSAPSGVTFNWYDAASNGNLLFSGSTFTTPTLNSNTTYYVESENGSGCKSTRTSVTVTIDAAPSSPTVSGTSICSGQTAMLTPSAPSGVTFNWYDAASNGNLLFSGSTFTTPTLNSNTTYYVESENGSGCKSTRTSVTVTIDAAPSSPTVSGTSICSGQTAMLTPSAPSGVTFNWYDAASNGNLLFSGSTFTTPTLNSNTTYYVESENGSGCKSTRTSVTVTIDAAPSSPTVSGTSICSGQTAMLTPSAPSGVTFNWYDAASNGNLLFSGSTFTTPTLNSNTTYYVESENGSGCKSTRTSVTVTIDAAPSSPTVIGTSICSGQTAMLTPSAPSGVTFNWYDAASNGNLLFSGSTFTTPTLNSNTTYYVESENGSGCKSTRTSVTVTIDAAPSSPTVIGTSICSGQTAMLTPSAPSGVTFNWYDAASNGNLLFSGSTFTTPTLNSNTTYYVESENGSGCKSTRTSVTVTIDAAPSSPTVSGTSICSGQTAMLTPSAPSGVTFNWYDAASNGNLLFSGSTFTTPTLNSNTTYYVESENGSGCKSTRTSVTVTIDAAPSSPTVIGTSICSGQTAMLTPSAPSGVTFNWYDAASNGNLLFSGSTFTTPTLNSNTTYYVESENGSGCKSTRTSVTVTIDAAPSSPTVIGTSICSGQTAMLTPSAPSGVTFNWYDAASNGNLFYSGSTFTTPTLNSNTTYYVESENGSGCKSTRTSVTVSIDQILNFSLGNDTLLCTGQILTLNQNIFGATYLWNNGSTLSSISISSSGTFWLEVTKGSCSKRDSINVQINSSGISVNLGPDLPICSGQNILLSQNISGVSYLWSNGSTLNSINISNSGLFWLEVTKGSCTNRDSIVITPSSGLIFNLGNDTTLCNGQTLNLSTNIAGANYLWSNGSTNNSISISSPGIYSLFANIGSCNGIDSINVGFGPADPVTKNPIICYNTSTTLIPSFPTGVTFNWYTNLGVFISSGNSFSTPPLTINTTYLVESKSISGCLSNRVPIPVTILQSPVISDRQVCSSGFATLVPISPTGTSFRWYNTTGPAIHIGPTFDIGPVNSNISYFVQSDNGSGCLSSRTLFDVTILNLPASPIINNKNICVGTSTNLSPTGPSSVSFKWYDSIAGGNLLFTGPVFSTPVLMSSKTYFVESENSNSCKSARVPVSINVFNYPIFSLGNDTSLCAGQTLTLTQNIAGVSYTWSDGTTNNSITVNTSGTYWLEIDNGSCTGRDSIDIIISTSGLSLNLGNDTSFGQTLTLTQNIAGVSYTWSDGTTNNSITVNTSGTYWLEIDNGSCTGRDSIDIIISTSGLSLNLGNDTSLCAGQTLTLTQNIAGVSYTWSDGTTNNSITVNTSGTYWLEIDNGSCTGRDSIDINISTSGLS
ncbi:MAG: hypothetical protein IPO64_13760 [Bacteroidetes bacterium]|nr:hypothetical protein [Bacteroidota bacterium]